MASFILVLRNINQQEGQTALSSVCLFKKTKQKPKVQVLLTDYLINYLGASQQNSFIIRQVTLIYFYK